MGKFSQFKLTLKSLASGANNYGYHLDKQFFTDMECADVRDADLNVALTVTYAHEVYDLEFHITGTVTVACDRCLDDLQLDIDTTYSVIVKLGTDYCDDSDEMIEIPESDPTVNVAYMIYDTVMLAIPVKHVHPLGKCNRTMSSLLKKHRASVAADEDTDMMNDLIDEMDNMPDEGGNDEANVDPRWDKLKDLK